jgi:hypothetical protein
MMQLGVHFSMLRTFMIDRYAKELCNITYSTTSSKTPCMEAHLTKEDSSLS